MVQNVSLVFDHQSSGRLAPAPCFRGGTPVRDTWEQAPWSSGERAPHSSFLSVRGGGNTASPGDSEDKAGTREDSWALRENGICFATFWVYWGFVTLSFCFLLWEWGLLSYAQPITEFGKHIWFYRFSAGEEFCLRISHISSLTHRWFRWYLSEIMDLRL